MPKANDRIGPYQLIRKLGKGAFGEVWLAKNVAALVAVTATEVALKIPLDDDVDLDAIRQEAAIWVAASGHANVLPILEASVYDEHVVIASEYAPDGSLKDWLKLYGERAPSFEVAVEMTRGMLAGLEHLHQRNIIHRDLKPDNILLKGTTPRIADFGISRVLKSTSQSAVMAGTPVYMAPEAFRRKRNEQTDLWSVGVMLYQMLAGRLPFMGQDMAEVMGAIIYEEPGPLTASVPAWLQAVIAKSLKKNPAERYRTAIEMRAALTEVRPEPPRIVITPPPQPKAASTLLISETESRLASKPQPAPEQVESPPKHAETQVDSYRTHLTEPVTPTTPSIMLLSHSRVPRIAVVVAPLAIVVIVLVMIHLASQEEEWKKPVPALTGGTTIGLGPSFTENLNGVTLDMIRVPGDSFMMGWPSPEQGRVHQEGEGPQHQVDVPSFYIGKFEVTQAQWVAVMGNNFWKAMMGSNPSYFKGNDNLPVESITWHDARAFCQKLRDLSGKAYRLPTEAEWEYAYRAKTTGDYVGDPNAMAWHINNSDGKTHLVGQKQPNAFGLYDMPGNVREWCEDVWHNNYDGAIHGNPPTDGRAWITGGDNNYRVLRGGSWNDDSGGGRAAWRKDGDPSARFNNVGFRVVVSAGTR